VKKRVILNIYYYTPSPKISPYFRFGASMNNSAGIQANRPMRRNGLDLLKKREEHYWWTINRAREFLNEKDLPRFLVAVQQVIIYRCTDGYLVLRYAERETGDFILTRHSSSTWTALLHEERLYDERGRESTRRLTLATDESTKFKGHSIDIAVEKLLIDGVILHPKWIWATVWVGEPRKDLCNGEELAKRDIRTLLSARRFHIQVEDRIEHTSDKVIHRLQNLLVEYRQCLLEATVEEDVQKFLKENPYILHPWGAIKPKYRLGDQYVCDFLVEDPLAPDFRHTFVEIEPVGTELFHKSEKGAREFRARVHHGLSQIRDWEIWIRENLDTLKKDFPEFDQAGFILIIGRSIYLSARQKQIIRTENARTMHIKILTYDDLADRLEASINSLKRL
jgi:hypothetical protein